MMVLSGIPCCVSLSCCICSVSFPVITLVCVLVAKSCPTFLDPMDCSPPGSFVHGILQARILEWVAIPGDLPDPEIDPGFLHCRQILYHLSHQGSP